MDDMSGTTPTNGDEALVEPGQRLLTIAQAAQYLNVPFGWLQVKVTQRAVPHTRLGKHVRFAPAHLARIVADGEVTTPPTTTPPQAAAPDTRLIPVPRRRRRSAS